MTGSRLARWGVVLAAVTATVVSLAAPAQAFPQASFHTLSTGNRGPGSTIGQLEAAVARYGGGNGPVPLGDVSFEHGGDIPGHASHELGVDVDLWPARTDSAQCTAGRITWQSATYDRAATRALVQAIRATASGHVALIYFNDPTLIAEGLTTSYPNHDNHLHVRYR